MNFSSVGFPTRSALDAYFRAERSLFRSLHRSDPEAARKALHYRWEAA